MTSQEEILEFFFNMSKELSNEGYSILNNIKHPFKDYKTEEELIKEELENKLEEENINYDNDEVLL